MSDQDQMGAAHDEPSQNAIRFNTDFNPTHSSVLSLVAGPFTDQVISIWGKNRIHEYLAAPDSRRHVWHSWLATQPNASDAYELLSRSKSRQIIVAGYGSCPSGMTGALGRLGPKSRTTRFYQSLFKVLETGGAMTQWLFHQKDIQNELVYVLSEIGNDELSQRAITRLLAKSVNPRWFGAVIWLIRRLAALSNDKNVEELILGSNNPVLAARKLAAQLPFPSAPWGEFGLLKPVETPGELAALGKQFRNCIGDQHRWIEAALAVQSGRRFYYHWTGEHSALLMFSRCGSLGWSLQEAAGPGNSGFHPETERQVQEILKSIAEIWPIDLNCSSAILFDDF